MHDILDAMHNHPEFHPGEREGGGQRAASSQLPSFPLNINIKMKPRVLFLPHKITSSSQEALSNTFKTCLQYPKSPLT